MKSKESTWGWMFDIGFRRFERLSDWIEAPNRIRPPVKLSDLIRKYPFPGWVVEPFIVAGFWAAIRDCRDWSSFLSLLIGGYGLVMLVSVHYLCSGMKRIPQFGLSGPSRARWWFEVSGLAAMLCMASALWGMSMPVPLEPLNFLLSYAVAGLFYLSFVSAIFGYLLGLAQRRRVRGYSLEMVNFFFWVILGSQLLMILMSVPVVGDLLIPILVAFGCVLLLVAGVLALKTRWTMRAHHQS